MGIVNICNQSNQAGQSVNTPSGTFWQFIQDPCTSDTGQWQLLKVHTEVNNWASHLLIERNIDGCTSIPTQDALHQVAIN